MTRTLDIRREQLLERWRQQSDEAEQNPLFEAFLEAFLTRSSSRIFQTHDEQEILGVLLAAFELAARRKPGERVIRLRQPEELPGRAAIEVLQEDRPFLVDTLRLLLRRRGLREQWMLHPTLRVERGPSGELLQVLPSDPPEPAEQQASTLRESFICVEVFPRLDAAAMKELETDLHEVMISVEHVTDDHMKMVRAVRDAAANVEYSGRRLDVAAGRADKICRFLDWLVDDHFVLMGVRRYDVTRRDGEYAVKIRPGAGLGLFRDERTSRFFDEVSGTALPPGMKASLEDPRIIQISKGWMESRVHRAGRLDRILVKEHDDDGNVCGIELISGLFTFAALRTPSSQLPLLAERLEQILEADPAPHGSHHQKALVTAFDSAPMEFLLGASVEDNASLISEIVEAEGTDESHVVVRTSAGGRAFYAVVILPRERYGESLRSAIRKLFEDDRSVGYVDDRVSFLEEGSALLHFFCTTVSGEVPERSRLQTEIAQLASRWDDRLTSALVARYGPAVGGELAARYVDAFPEGLHLTTPPEDAVRDVAGLEALFDSGEPQVGLWVDRSRASHRDQMLRLYLGQEMLLSDLMPLIDQLGIRVVDARQVRIEPLDRPPAHLHGLRIEPIGADQQDLDAIQGRVGDALRAVLGETSPSDLLNALILNAGLDWRQVDLLRSYIEYYNQIQASLTRRFVSEVLLQNPVATRLLVQFHEVRLAPGLDESSREQREQELRGAFTRYRDRIGNLNEDRALGAMFELIEATLRSNLYADNPGPHRIATKLDPSKISELRPPFTYREIFVHGPGVSGIHLRGGPVARGGLRWSDRLDDFRTEVLGLMRTQQLKNGLIVPVGAKGGFVLRKMDLSPQEARVEADAKYAIFIAALLDVTDNLDASGRVVPPPGVHRRDGDDPYLVVAADKGTAHLSDTANRIAQDRGFWLGDAFASGGSVGYDHKKYAITARGAWECVRHHFTEMGIDPDRDVYSVVGIGDMSGDVFGNGLLLMQNAQLIAAFDHRHIFIDPQPDPAASWQERKRLFELPRSTWADYDETLLSEGGGVYPRSAKRIALSEAAQARLGVTVAAMTGPELIRAILSANVDLLWNGGIGTYAKASHETHAQVGDRANESVRIDASEIGARVIGEGGNLGLTQAARVEAAMAGVRLDSDAIHNSGGVDLSDHEVNFKILLAQAVHAGELGPEDRTAQLFAVADEACEDVLAHNRAQTLAISLDERRSRDDLERFRVAIEVLCASQGLTAADVGLPDEPTLQQRKTQGEGLTRPELSVLIGLAKLDLRLALANDAFVEAEAIVPLHADYYPAPLRERYSDALQGHRLRREITALEAANRIIDVGGVSAVTNLVAKRGIGAPVAAAAWKTAMSLLDADRYRDELLALRGTVSIDGIYDSMLELDEAVQEVARYLIAEGIGLQSESTNAAWRQGLFGLSENLDGFLSRGETTRFRERQRQLVARGLPDDLARVLAGTPLADRGLNVIRLVQNTKLPATALAAAYARLGDESGINWVYQNLPLARAEDIWERIVLMDLRTEMLALQRELTERSAAARPEDPLGAVDDFLRDHAEIVLRVQSLIPETLATPSASALSVVTQTLLRLRSRARGGQSSLSE